MNTALWIAKKKVLAGLIKKVSDANGGDDVEWLREYAKDVIEAHKDCLDEAIACFSSVLVASGQKPLETPKKAVKTNICGDCGYVPPFCRFDLYNKCSNIGKNVP